MADQTLDSLVVSLGLEIAGFKAGLDVVQRGLADLRKNVGAADTGIGASAKSMASSIGSLGLKFTGLFFAVKGIGDVIHGFKQLSDTLWHLGIDSKNVGTSANELRSWQEVARLAGGSAEDAASTIGDLQSSIFNLKFRGQVSDNLIMLQRLGVAYLTAGGQMRKTADIAMEASQHLQKSGMDRAMRYQYALSIGMHGGLATAVADSPEKLRTYLDKAAKDNKDISGDMVDSQTALNEGIVSLTSQLADASAVMLNDLTPMLADVVKALGLLTTPIEAIGNLFGAFHDVGTGMGEGMAQVVLGIKGLFSSTNPYQRPQELSALAKPDASGNVYKPPTISERYHNPINLKATGTQVAGEQGIAIFGSQEEGERAALHQMMLDRKRGNETIRGLLTKYAPAADGAPTANYIAFMSKKMGIGADVPLGISDYPAFIAGMNQFETGKKDVSTAASVGLDLGINPLPSTLGAPPASVIPPNPAALGAARGAVPTPGATLPPASARGPSTASTNVQIDSITVNTQATNASRMAAETDAALRRKLLASNVETGLV